MLLAAASLCQRELVRFLRQRHRVIGAFATPIVFWLLIGGGMGHSFQMPAQAATQTRTAKAAKDGAVMPIAAADATPRATADAAAGPRPVSSATSAASTPPKAGYMVYFFPGTILMILLFTAIFSTISVIEDRREGFLQSVLVAPVSRMAIVLGKILGGTVLATGQGFIFLLLAPTVGIHLTVPSVIEAVGFMALISFALTALGLSIAWRMSSTQGFHAIMNLFLMPMWFLSGALFPASGALGGLAWVMRLNPLTYGLNGLRDVIERSAATPIAQDLLVSVVFALILFILASAIAAARSPADVR